MNLTHKVHDTDVVALLGTLAELDYDAVSAYRVAIARLERPDCRLRFAGFLQAHVRHTHNLRKLTIALGGVPPEGPDQKHLLTAGRAIMGSIIGGDRAVLEAILDNEDDINAAYELAASRWDLPGSVHQALERNLQDDRTQRDWVEARLLVMQSTDGGCQSGFATPPCS